MTHEPMTLADAQRRLAGVEIPGPVLDVLSTLVSAGHRAALVGGAVRDALLGHPHGDWDVATSATPQEVVELFPRTIPTGIRHGTVTVLTGKGRARAPVEVTTFRGEGRYEDGRRPTEVRFLRSLEDDLARRDFTVNALAWDPISGVLTDAFAGLADLHAGRIRAVGVALDRFREDGLRTMRAVRFCATLGFALEAATEAAIGSALDVLDLVSRERVREELWKLIGAARPELGLRPMWSTGMWSHVLLPPPDDDREAAIAQVGRMSRMPADPEARLSRLLLHADASDPRRHALIACVDGLKPSAVQRAKILALTGPAIFDLRAAVEPSRIRAAVAVLGRGLLEPALDVLDADPQRRSRIVAACEGAALQVGELAISGRDLVAEGVAAPGPALGSLLRDLLAAVLEDPTLNHREALIARARSRAQSV